LPQARARDGSDPCAVPLGSHVTVVLRAVPAAAAATVLARVTASAAGGWQLLDDGSGGVNSNTAAPPLTVHGLLQHEGKLSVLNFSMRSVQGYDAPLSSSEPLLFVTGLRSFTGRPLLSEDGQGGADKHKLLRYLQPGGAAVGSVYAPISYPPLPLLAFKV
jgi:pre-rRNA-processing protein TSR1